MRVLSKIPHKDELINRIQDGLVAALNPLLRLLALPDGEWIDGVLVAPWSAYGSEYATPGYRRDVSGYVHMRGLIRGGTTPSALQVALELPEGVRPLRRVLLSTAASSWSGTSSPARVDVLTSGQVQVAPLATVTGTCDWLSLDGLSFLAEG